MDFSFSKIGSELIVSDYVCAVAVYFKINNNDFWDVRKQLPPSYYIKANNSEPQLAFVKSSVYSFLDLKPLLKVLEAVDD